MEMSSQCYFNNIIRCIASGFWPHAPLKYQSPAQLFVDKVIKDPDEMLMSRVLPALNVPEPGAAIIICYHCSTSSTCTSILVVLWITVILQKQRDHPHNLKNMKRNIDKFTQLTINYTLRYQDY